MTVAGAGTSDRSASLERELQDSEALFRAAFHTLPDAVTLTEQGTGLFVSVNEGAGRVTGWDPAEMTGRTAVEIGLWEGLDREEFVARIQADGEVRDFATRLRRKDGTVIEVVLSARPVTVGGRRLLITVTRDVSRQAAAERARDRFREQFLQSQKLEALGRLAGGVAHDFNNLLTVILSAAESLRERPGTCTTEQLEGLAEIETAAGRATELTRQLLAFARRQPARQVPVDLGTALSRSERLLRRVLGEDVALRVHARPGISMVLCDPAQVEQVVLNLAVNARDAMPGGGSLLLEAGDHVLDDAEAAHFSGARPGRYVRLAATDDGAGMPPEILERIFEPFFTTKAPGQGTGLGLSTVHGIVAQAGGFVRARSQPGQGTTIEILLPAVDAVPSEGAEAPPPRVAGGTETVLVVEDDPRVRDVVVHALRSAGYQVLPAEGPAQAEALAREVDREVDRIDLVVADVVLPGRSGPQVVEALRALRPGLRALYVSGYPADAVERDGVPAPGADLLPKPFTPSGLLSRVRAALDRRT